MIRQLIFLTLSAASFAFVANGAAIVRRSDAVSDITAQAASLFGDATSIVNSEFAVATSAIESAFGHTSLPSGFVQTVTSEAGHIESIISSLGGEAITLASAGQGAVTSFAGTHFTVAASPSGSPASIQTSSGFVTSATSRPLTSTSYAAPSSTVSQKNSASASVQSAGTMMTIFVTLATLVGSTAVGVLVVL
ncbi:hypothetical protein DFH05DRAFT_1469451 [Lentinula detonsa]|uniref:Uncharacterized protein n=1 Tax=Lentinula detonsa TaxID=2804962 RepID=A0A9W8PBT3_9AGAR|nr:hypothetical protein DFH05DRAFT_1469451 [Lentinula detonsa]